MRLGLETRYNVKVPVNHPIVPWLVIHAGFTHNRFQVGHDVKVPFTRARGKLFDKALLEFGECIHYKVPKRQIGPDLNKWDDRWADGVS